MGSTHLWQSLRVETSGIPSLLVSAAFTSQSYSIQITDLANVWSESLERKPVIARGLKEDTSIDPTEGPDQIRKLLDLLQAAFYPDAAEHGNTSLALSKDNDDTLVIHITVSLPKGLRPLKWPMYLKKLPHAAIATELVLPLLEAHRRRAQEHNQLVSMLREKDNVITKLLDKLEASGTGLEHIFTALSGRRKVSRAAAEDRVNGLAPFKDSDVRERVSGAEDHNGPANVPSLIDSIFSNESGVFREGACQDDLDIEDAPALNDWWTKLTRGRSVTLVQRAKVVDGESRHDVSPSPTARGGSKAADEDDDDFQVQATPPGKGAQKRGQDQAIEPEANDNTTGESDVEIPDSLPTPAQHTRKATAAKSSGSQLDKTGKGKEKTHRPVTSPSPPPRPAEESDADLGSATASDIDDDDDDLNGPPAKTSPASPPPRPKEQSKGGGLGRIGGRAKVEKAATPPMENAKSGDTAEQDGKSMETGEVVTPRRGRTKLGLIGGKAAKKADGEEGAGARKTSDAEDADQDTSKAERPRETSLERADRKRAQLRAELERKSGGPAKKKRKF